MLFTNPGMRRNSCGNGLKFYKFNLHQITRINVQNLFGFEYFLINFAKNKKQGKFTKIFKTNKVRNFWFKNDVGVQAQDSQPIVNKNWIKGNLPEIS